MAAPVSTSAYTNPYSGFLSSGEKGRPFDAMKRFSRDVRLPDLRELPSFDATEPMRRFARDVRPPRFTPLNPSTGKPMASSRLSAWDLEPTRAAKAYRAASSAPPGWTSINSLL